MYSPGFAPWIIPTPLSVAAVVVSSVTDRLPPLTVTTAAPAKARRGSSGSRDNRRREEPEGDEDPSAWPDMRGSLEQMEEISGTRLRVVIRLRVFHHVASAAPGGAERSAITIRTTSAAM